MTYYYPNNLDAKALFANYWTGKDLAVILVLFILSILATIVFHSFLLFIALIVYIVFSAKIANGYSITRLAILYFRFLVSDILVYHWR